MAFERATAVQQVDSHTYAADFKDDWCIGAVPHGGYVTATVQRAVKKHFDTTLAKQDQPHTLALHLDFLRRTQTGPVKISIQDVKLGRQTSVVHITLSQDGREEVVGYITNSNLSKEVGVSFDTHWTAHPERIPLTSPLSALEKGQDPKWSELHEWPNSAFRKATRQLRAWFPRDGQPRQNIYDMWTCLRDPSETWTNEKLGFLVDMFPQVCETFYRKFTRNRVPFWYPTLLLNLEVKKVLPEGGAKFLFTRLQTKVIRNGRYDLEIIVMDEKGEMVALSHHVCFALSAERNSAGRNGGKKVVGKL
ncbi:uncharacterized protein MYCFIDRAFT_31682 [Pseudocercospora fijiensis CIRAD86]|uniref:Thioesterase domain-containing protein n=1 Tax=Pseudocercospora fijiensis (strain CIRAD86) TaxID=383855 RepID=M2YR28_PSEFD|nr:uncharacterized protein MYCFIDRAFT_31682 [Pseudocercospora fijiensis CIRAD86]EME80165.1 hypothetical protein MYCFIDRAFT_31682 [Pseudocercospora fijiensis CIRAD86]